MSERKNKAVIIIGAENIGGVRSYVLDIVQEITDIDFYILTSELLYNESYLIKDNVRVIKNMPFFSLCRFIFKLKRNSDILLFGNTLRGGLFTFYLSLICFVDYIYVGHTVRSLQLQKSFKKSLITIIEFFIFTFSKKNIAICNEEYNYLSKRFKNCLLIKTGKREPVIEKSLQNISQGANKIIFNIGSLDERKNPYLFIKIAERFKEKKDVFFIWFGTGELYKEISNFIDINRLENIAFYGKISNEEVLNKISNYYAMLFTSQLEGVPISILEALSLNKPVVVSNYTGCSPLNIVKVGENGYVYNNIDEAVECINKILEPNKYDYMINFIKMESLNRTYTYTNFIKSYYKVFLS